MTAVARPARAQTPPSRPRLVQAVLDAFQQPDIRRKLLFTIGLLVVFRFVAHIPIPGVNTDECDCDKDEDAGEQASLHNRPLSAFSNAKFKMQNAKCENKASAHSMFQNDFHPLTAVRAQHLDRRL